MKRIILVASIAALSGCSAISATTSGGNISADAAACAASLVAGGIIDPAGIPQLALSTPSCVGLAHDVLDAAIKAAQAQAPVAQRNAARMMRR
jgi:hypothetical protein